MAKSQKEKDALKAAKAAAKAAEKAKTEAGTEKKLSHSEEALQAMKKNGIKQG